MARTGTPSQQMLTEKLYVFDLPPDLLQSLHIKQNQDFTSVEAHITPSVQDVNQTTTPATSCNLCSLSFPTVQEQRAHVRSDLHNYNLKQKVRGLKAVTEVEFEKLVEELDESISGSDSDESTEDEEELQGPKAKDTLSSLLKRQARIHDGQADDAPPEVKKRKKGAGNAPIYWFKSDTLPSNTSLGVYRSIFSTHEQEEETHLVDSLRAKQIARSKPVPVQKKAEDDEDEGGVPLPGAVQHAAIKSSGPHYFLCMIGGGHFAAMLVSLTPKITRKAGVEDRSATVIAHKTFHRYTTRRKQGGSQSANDNSKGNAHSAGSSLRRYNEVALENDVRSLLSDWKPWIDTADLIFVRATGSQNRKVLFGPYEGQVLSQKDDRLRGFPFNTRRATQSELLRAFIELTRVKVSTIDEAALARQAAEEEVKAKQQQQRLNDRSSSGTSPAKPSKEEEEAILHTTQIQALIRRSKAPAVSSYYQSNSLSPDFHFIPADKNHHAPTALHLAAASSSAACVSVLLIKVGADPGTKNGEGRTAYELAGDRATRDAFSLARGQLGEAQWDWTAAAVPVALSQDEYNARASREKEEKAAEEQAEKERRQAEAQRLRQEDVQKHNASKDKKYGISKTLAAPMTAEQRRMDDARGMTDDVRLRMERERRARAAEERMKRLQNGG